MVRLTAYGPAQSVIGLHGNSFWVQRPSVCVCGTFAEKAVGQPRRSWRSVLFLFVCFLTPFLYAWTMEKLARVQKDLEAVVDATRKAGDEKLSAVQAVRTTGVLTRRTQPALTRSPARRAGARSRNETEEGGGGCAGGDDEGEWWLPVSCATECFPSRGDALCLSPAYRVTRRHTQRCASSRRACWTSKASCRRRCPRCGTS